MTKKTPRFEDSLLELEQLVERLEQGDTSLEESLKAFERGVQLTRVCQTALKEAEQKIQVLLEVEGQVQLKPFNPES
ncbi:MAG: exodeoxyribonuclease VII small subunit [Methylococcaceae bacterium]|nr:MAG: exodeoxyribonuclease VII small subunit [Methylococcaceae bacterium]